MNTNHLKKFAQEARRKLLELVGSKLELVLTTDSAELREKASQLRKLQEAINASSKEQVIDKVAYTWFNRLMALRFMDANDYQPIGIKVVTPKEGYTLPELLDEAKQGNIPDELSVNNQHIYDVLDGKIPSANPQNEAYKELLIGACNHLNKVFPFLFEKLSDYTELLLPDDLISEFSIVQDIRDGMTIEDCQEVEIIGWIYQFYISEKKDEVFASKSKVKKEDIPAATQLFTPRWIVEYMVQNTVGKLWLQNKPNSKLREHMPYFIESPSVESENYLKVNSVEEITLLDQACGSGHILVYGFELLTKIYEEEGYNPSEIPQLIIEKNLFGFEIDERAAQLAGMALLMKARSYQRRVFRKELKPNILCYQDLKLTTDEIKEAFIGIGTDLSDELLHDLKNMQQATNLGSLIIPHTSLSELERIITEIDNKFNTTSDVFLKSYSQQLTSALSQLIPLTKKYHCIADNPPYMGGNMNKELGNYVKVNYPDSKADLMTCFMEAGWNALHPMGILGMINLPSWLFLSSFEKLRKKLIKEKHIDSLLHMGRGIFGIDWGSTAFIIRNQKIDKESYYFKLHKRNFQHLYPNDIRDIFLKSKNDSSIKINFDKYREDKEVASIESLIDESGLKISFKANQKDFLRIPSNRIGFWLSEQQYYVLENSIPFHNVCVPKTGMQTGNNTKYTRNWFEVSHKLQSRMPQLSEEQYWIPYQMGGSSRKWYGNLTHLINWKDDGELIRMDPSCRLNAMAKKENYFKKGISWKRITSGTNTIRLLEDYFLFDQAADSLFVENENEFGYLFAFMNSKTIKQVFEFISPTLNLTSGTVKEIPVYMNSDFFDTTNVIVENSIHISKEEWNSREKAWDFLQNELIRIDSQDLEETYDLYQQYWKNKFFQLHKNEEELNKQFIEIYGLQDELTPEVPLKDITILKEETDIVNGELVFDAEEVFAQFMSYAVGCMFGRYSLDKEGLILANQGETLEDYLKKVEKTEDAMSFLPDDDNIIPILDDEWFEDDIVNRFYEFLKVSFGKPNFEKNLAFVEECLGKDIRKYFVKDFYADHIKRYKKRPIYWMFSSPKGSFNVLIYMHRYTPDTLNQILNGYLKEYREKLNTHLEHLDHIIETGSSSEQTKASKEKDKLRIVLLELQEYERDVLYPLATERIAIDLDDGVLVNYNKFGKAIAPLAGLNDKKTKDKVKKFDWIDTTTIK
ncbi:MAG: BREX-1 system adenine-specific DNA-methyltransferase PglX [Altibacter sp.]|uniref:BREX-1 system adenine-specific DNA-methyltransferase PglX n=1 Tax=Altibacter sp. TaxID=2024823 RepID=UPI001DDBB4FA|nr:BREX-1 system adenine-specific DNA-methyltransferase PglX [Altibacter sp.]MBZ0328277.1 BREX-1 system adenine-specific DNA-methyltransferase PglX [Altibacter sp.]